MVSVTTGHGTSLMAPSTSRKTTTSPERMRPPQRAGLEAGRASAMMVMTGPRDLEWLLGFKTNRGNAGRHGRTDIFQAIPGAHTPWQKEGSDGRVNPAHDKEESRP